MDKEDLRERAENETYEGKSKTFNTVEDALEYFKDNNIYKIEDLGQEFEEWLELSNIKIND